MSKIWSNWTFTFGRAPYTAATHNSKALTPRCDNNAVNRMGRGCVFPEGPVTLVYSKTNQLINEVARHIGLAQESGLPSTLTRIEPRLAQANRDIACPRNGGLTRPPGKQCDEYPFASSVQGGDAGGAARVFDGCDLTIIPGSGSTGFSRCRVDENDNQEAGRMLTRIYHAQRVIAGDKLTVLITP